MKPKARLGHTLGACAAAAILSACGGRAIDSPTSLPQTTARAAHADRGRSWMLPEAKNDDLLYVTDFYTQDVFVYDYPSGTQVGQLTGLDYPSGLCVDAKGDVFVTNGGDSYTVVEYAHGGTSILGTFKAGGIPAGCSISPRGDLAITNTYDTTGSTPSSVMVYEHAAGPGTQYFSADCYKMWPGGYDDKNNLWLIGAGARGQAVCELTPRAKNFKTISFDQGLDNPGQTMWDGKYLTLTDTDYGNVFETAIYRTQESAGKLLVVGSPTVLTDTCLSDEASVFAPFIVGTANTPKNRREGALTIGPNAICIPYGDPQVEYWAYPAGGNPQSSLSDPPKDPQNAVISPAGLESSRLTSPSPADSF